MPGTTLTDRALIRLSGDDVRGFLQGLVTNDVLAPLPVYAGLLTPQGKALFDFIVWGDGDDLLIDCERDAAPDLAKRLKLYRLRRPIEIGAEEQLRVHWSRDPGQGVPDPRDAALGYRWLAPDDGAAQGWHAHRLATGVPEGRAEIGEATTLWLETNALALNGVSFTKGCYVGQENTARMHHRGKVTRRLAVVPLGDAKDGVRAQYPEHGVAVVRERLGTADDAAG